MGTYIIPRNLKGETRILYIFSIKSLATTAIGALVGSVFYIIFGLILGLTTVGLVFVGIFGLIGYIIGALKIPTLSGLKFTKKIGGESLDEIIKRYIVFRAQKKKYGYYITKEEE